jgi:hypothetical protein
VNVAVDRMIGREGAHPVGLAALGFVGGLAVGLAAWSSQLHRSRRDLFSAQPWRRLAALGYLGGCRPNHETLRLLDDYVTWESRPALRRRGERLLRRLEHYLD